jgi:hypothetical protein
MMRERLARMERKVRTMWPTTIRMLVSLTRIIV